MTRFHPAGRLVELRLLVWAAVLTTTGFIAVVAADAGSFAPAALIVPLTVLAVFAVLHLFLVGTGFRGDQLLLPLAVGLTGIGFVLVQRLAPLLLIQQLTWLVIAAGAFIATILVPRDLSVLGRYKYTWALIGIVLLVLPLAPVVGREINGARIWIRVGPGQFEPWEAVKIVLVIFFAGYLDEHREVLGAARRRFGPIPVPPLPYLVPIVLMWLV
ncbi:MAG TPA: FtsW/RodA/SpoVE family cell cycle protein, partial [Candidatus Limnocylindria bacterium]